MYKLDKNCNSVFSLLYHFITVVKYRKKVFINSEIVTDVKTIIENIAKDFDVEIVDQVFHTLSIS